MNSYIILSFLTFLLLIPVSIIVIYLGGHLKDKNGEIGKLRKLIFSIKIGWIIYLVGHLVSTFLVSKNGLNSQVVLLLILITLPVMLVHWWALYKIRRLIS